MVPINLRIVPFYTVSHFGKIFNDFVDHKIVEIQSRLGRNHGNKFRIMNNRLAKIENFFSYSKAVEKIGQNIRESAQQNELGR